MLSPTVAWILTSVLGLISVFIIGLNWALGLHASIRKASYSWVPFVGGLAGCLCLLVCPIPRAAFFAWIPLVLDLSIPGFLYALLVMGAFRSR